MLIYFKFDEQCPVNNISYSSVFDCNINEKCLEITPSYFLKYSNYYDDYYNCGHNYDSKIAIDINITNPKI